MKLNNKGFAISSIMYIILVLGVILISLIFATLSSRKLILDKLKEEVLATINDSPSLTYRQAIKELKNEVITYMTDNSLEQESIKVENLNSTISSDVLQKYKLNDKYLTAIKTSDSYDVYLGKISTISNTTELPKNTVDIVDYKIYGNTYQETRSGINLINNYDVVESTSTPGSLDNAVINEEYIDIVRKTTYDYANIPISLKAGKTYTLWYECEVYDRPADDTTNNTVLNLGFTATDPQQKTIKENGKYYYIFTYTATEDIDTKIRVIANYGSKTPAKVRFKIMLVEGKYTLNTIPDYEPYGKKPSPEFPSEVLGVGDLVTDTTNSNYGKYNISIKTNGKNLFNVNSISNSNYEINGDTVYVKVITSNSSTSTSLTLKELCPTIKAGEIYTISYVAEDNSYISIGSYSKNNFWFNGESRLITEENLNTVVRMGGGSTSTNRNVNFSNIQVEKGDNVTEYEPYIEPITTNIYLDEPLRKLGTYIDNIDYGRNINLKNIKERLLDGSESWTIDASGTWTPVNDLIKLLDYTNVIMSNKLSIGKNHFTSVNFSIGGYADYNDRYKNQNWIYYKNSELTISTDVKTWFNENPVKVQYPLSTPKEETIELPKINVNKGASIVEIATDIAPSKYEFTVIEKIIEI